MKKLAFVAAVCLIASAVSLPAVERDYRAFLIDGSWFRVAHHPEIVDGKARVRLPAGQLVVMDEEKIDWDRTAKWNDTASGAHITTNLPLPRGLMERPMQVAVVEDGEVVDYEEQQPTTAGDPRERLKERIAYIDLEILKVNNRKVAAQGQLAAAREPEVRGALREKIDGYNRRIGALRSERNGLSLRLLSWGR